VHGRPSSTSWTRRSGNPCDGRGPRQEGGARGDKKRVSRAKRGETTPAHPGGAAAHGDVPFRRLDRHHAR
jgi:hypothetical protein